MRNRRRHLAYLKNRCYVAWLRALKRRKPVPMPFPPYPDGYQIRSPRLNTRRARAREIGISIEKYLKSTSRVIKTVTIRRQQLLRKTTPLAPRHLTGIRRVSLLSRESRLGLANALRVGMSSSLPQ
jgi:hypothetical protein